MSVPPNPDFEQYRQQLLHRRRYYPIYGLLLLITGGLGLLGLLSMYLDNPGSLLPTQAGGLLHDVLLIGFLALVIAGIVLIARAYKAPGNAEVQRYRQAARQRLFLQANGRAIPWWSYIIIRVLIMLVGLIFCSGALLVFFNFGAGAWDGWIYLLIGVFLISLVFYFIPRELRKIPAISAEELARNLIAGEATTGEDHNDTF
ncbi:hypothetical protein KDA_58820 [Dictyobacter alpinus]|uniref:Uncharacterized protein n=1 Tax=Dictyobacter alpinus TaxID=2014873 RepID=A0A402BG60_9CHLR|nr:hypothetical protein [Dictyobacter alpinus]GCE30398.1 hypothetical protein KDA_58820 [Dictyobacter alpinus]